MYKFKYNSDAFGESVLDIASDYVSHCKITSSPASYKRFLKFANESFKGFSESKIDVFMKSAIMKEIESLNENMQSDIRNNYLVEQAKNACF